MPGHVSGIHVLFFGKDADGRARPGHHVLHHACGLFIATIIVTTSLVRLMISRFSFGPM